MTRDCLATGVPLKAEGRRQNESDEPLCFFSALCIHTSAFACGSCCRGKTCRPRAVECTAFLRKSALRRERHVEAAAWIDRRGELLNERLTLRTQHDRFFRAAGEHA